MHQVLYLTESECQKLNKEAASADKYENMRFELECSGKIISNSSSLEKGNV